MVNATTRLLGLDGLVVTGAPPISGRGRVRGVRRTRRRCPAAGRLRGLHGRSGPALAGRRPQQRDGQERGEDWRSGVRFVAIDMYTIFKSALRDALPRARLIVDHFHLVQLANQALTEVRRAGPPSRSGADGPQRRVDLVARDPRLHRHRHHQRRIRRHQPRHQDRRMRHHPTRTRMPQPPLNFEEPGYPEPGDSGSVLR